jgi:transcription initiation factor TFIIIB Brf1 subunit/transcription initiation factor TFIIB
MSDFLLYEQALNEYNKISKNTENNIIINNLNININEEYLFDNCDTESINDNLSNKKESDKPPDKICPHDNVISENGSMICEVCGKELEKNIYQDKEWRYYGQSDSKRTSDPNRVHARKIDDKNIFKDVENMGFSDKITTLANDIYQEVTKGGILRGNSRKAVIFSAIFHSFKIHGKPQSHEKLIKMFELNKKSSLKGLKYVNLNASKNSLVHTTYITPVNLVEDIMEMFNASKEQKKEVFDLYEKIKNKSSDINRSRPQSIASGLVFFWVLHKNIDISLKDFAKKVNLSELTILKLSRSISTILDIYPEGLA